MNDAGFATCKRATSRVAIVALFLTLPRVLFAQTVTVPAGIGPLPDLQGGAKVGAVVTKGHIDTYRSLVPPEVAALVDEGDFAFEAVARPRTVEIFGAGSAGVASSVSIDQKGLLSPQPESVEGPLFSVASAEVADGDSKDLAYKILWNTTTHQWRQRSLVGSVSLLAFNEATDEGRRVDFSVSRIYPAALGQSPGTLKPMFREKISAVAPSALSGLTWLTLRFLGADTDYLWAASPITGEVRQMTGSNRADPFFSGAFSPDDLFVWSGKVELVEPSRVALMPMLVPVIEGTPMPQIVHDGVCSSTDFSKTSPIDLNLSSKRFEGYPAWVPSNSRMALRNVWRVDVLSRDPFSRDAKQSIYVDAETSLPVYRVVWRGDGNIQKIVIGMLGSLGGERGGTPGWRGEVVVTPSSSSVAVVSLHKLEVCSRIIPGRGLLDFDPSHIGSPSTKKPRSKAPPKVTPAVDPEPVDE